MLGHFPDHMQLQAVTVARMMPTYMIALGTLVQVSSEGENYSQH